MLLIFLAVVSAAAAADPSATDVLGVVARSVPSAAAATPESDAGTFFAGHYAVSPEVARRAGPSLTGDHLYLFPDMSYLYTEWGCLMPETIADRGTWRFGAGCITLDSDKSVSQKHARHDRSFVALSVELHGVRQLFLLGLPRAYAYFREHTSPPDDFMFHICSRWRIAQFTESDAPSTKARLMKTAWNPSFFKE